MRGASELPVNPITLRFEQDGRELEKAYRSFAFQENLQHIRICHWMAILFYSVYIFLDFHLSPENTSLFMIIRLGIVLPLFCLGLALSYLPWYERIYTFMLAFYVVLTSSGYVVMGVLTPPDIHFVYFIGILICLIFGYTYIRLPLMSASAAGVIVLAIYLVVEIRTGNHSDKLFAAYVAYLAGINILLTIIRYMQEKTDRENFYLCHLLVNERDTINRINDSLTDLVKKRTSELLQLDEALKKVKTLSGLLPICSSC